MGMRDVMQALSEGAGRQSAIGGLMFQDAQLREGRTYEEAMAKERERRANLEWGRRERVTGERAETTAEALLAGQEGMQADRLEQQAIEAEKTRKSSEYMSRLGEAGATARQKDLITHYQDSAEKIAKALVDKTDKDRKWAIDDAKLLATSKAAKDKIDRAVKRAEAEEKNYNELLKGLKDANVEWSEEEQRYVSGDQYMVELDNSYKRVRAAWLATGIEPLMAEKNINSVKYGWFVQGAVHRMQMESRGDEWKDIVKGLQSDPDSSDYIAALEMLETPLNEALEYSGIRVTAGDKQGIRDAIIERIVARKDELEDPKTKKEPPPDTGDLGSSLLGPDKIDNIALDITVADIGTVAAIQAEIEASPVTGKGPRGAGKAKHPLAKDLQTAMKRDPEYLLPLLIQEREKILENQEYYGKKPYEKRLEKIEALIQQFEGLLGGQASAGDLGDGDIEGMEAQEAGMQMAQTQPEPAGLLNQQGGMISRADELSYAPEDVNARWA